MSGTIQITELIWTLGALPAEAAWIYNGRNARLTYRVARLSGTKADRAWAGMNLLLTTALLFVTSSFILLGILAMTRRPATGHITLLGWVVTVVLVCASLWFTVVGAAWSYAVKVLLGEVKTPVTASEEPDHFIQIDLHSASFAHNPDAIVMASRSGTILDVNGQAEAITGRSRQDLVGRPLSILVPADRRAGHGDLMAGFFANPEVRIMGHHRDVAIVRRTGDDEEVVPVRIHLAWSAIARQGLVAIATIHRSDQHWASG